MSGTMIHVASLVRQLVRNPKVRTVARSDLCTFRKLQNSTSRGLPLSRNFTSSPETLSSDDSVRFDELNRRIEFRSSFGDTICSIGAGLRDNAIEYTDEATAVQSSLPLGEFSYRGEGMNGEVCGHGILIYPDGRSIEGKFNEERLWVGGNETQETVKEQSRHNRENLENNTGVLELKDGNRYEGQLKGGLMHGQGKKMYPDGRTFEGDFKEGQTWNGAGVYTHPSGDVYEGELRAGKMHGKGKLTCLDGRTQEGEFREGMFYSGFGCIRSKDGSVYEGFHEEGTRWGQGKLTYADGLSVEGEFRRGHIYNVTGAFRTTDGSLYEGTLSKSHRHGQGKLILKDGTIYEGRWELGTFVEGSVTLTDGQVSQGVWKNKKLLDGKIDFIDAEKNTTGSSGRYRGDIKSGKEWNGAYYTQDGSVMKRWVEGKVVPIDKNNNNNAPAIAAAVVPSTIQESPASTAVTEEKKITKDKTTKKKSDKKDSPVVVKSKIKVNDQEVNVTSLSAEAAPEAASKAKEVVRPRKVGRSIAEKTTVAEDEAKKNKRQGQGKIATTNKNKKGEVKDMEHTRGKQLTSSKEKETAASVVVETQSVYSGELKDGQHHGQGKLTYPDGRCFEGEFREGKIWNGTGTVIFKNENVFVGEIKEGNAWNGRGVLTLKDGNMYEGALNEGKRHGQGKLTFVDGNVQEGEFQNGHLVSGYGYIRYKDDSVYKGRIREGMRHDQGRMVTKDGAVWEGRWATDAFVKGALTFASGEKVQGTFRAKKVWNAILYSKDGGIKSRWVDGAAAGDLKQAQISN